MEALADRVVQGRYSYDYAWRGVPAARRRNPLPPPARRSGLRSLAMVTIFIGIKVRHRLARLFTPAVMVFHAAFKRS